jgi:hypothetical protein
MHIKDVAIMLKLPWFTKGPPESPGRQDAQPEAQSSPAQPRPMVLVDGSVWEPSHWHDQEKTVTELGRLPRVRHRLHGLGLGWVDHAALYTRDRALFCRQFEKACGPRNFVKNRQRRLSHRLLIGGLVGRTPGSTADPLVGFCGTRASRADQGVRPTTESCDGRAFNKLRDFSTLPFEPQ